MGEWVLLRKSVFEFDSQISNGIRILRMYNFECENAEYKHQGTKMWIHCKAINNYCAFQRYCLTKRDVELQPESQDCKYNPLNKTKKAD